MYEKCFWCDKDHDTIACPVLEADIRMLGHYIKQVEPDEIAQAICDAILATGIINTLR